MCTYIGWLLAYRLLDDKYPQILLIYTHVNSYMLPTLAHRVFRDRTLSLQESEIIADNFLTSFLARIMHTPMAAHGSLESSFTFH